MRDLELYYEHYKETYALSKQAQLRRNKYYIVLCLLEALSFLFLINPDKVADLFSVGISSKLHTTLVLGNVTLQTLLWILIAYVNVRYCQDTLYVERLYLYINKIEKAISKISNSSIFNRESDEYTRNYPMVLNFIDLFYKMFSPILFMVINTVRILEEWKTYKISLALLCDSAIFFVIFVITWFYFFEIHHKITAWSKKYIPFVNKLAKLLRKLLKDV